MTGDLPINIEHCFMHTGCVMQYIHVPYVVFCSVVKLIALNCIVFSGF